ncbi:YbaB/EbfC family nucleoid-associated protein [Nocardia sp. CDC160]|uniref:YbaB/EbfC family nucleoid-associated protein n=1 Tax=Nocardia sp. CDC160 TaxID=3112166 RepID=UPI002DC00FE5|nr:YbaB/EbfC family nucleoid-associated protein [Nocardia sp. CDC160]MEC3913313.1 YbaB/EbfC family nucleoid-associated protein [Nocardia sp. CDC160]
MANEFIKGELASMIDEFQAQMRILTDIQQKRAQLLATGYALQKRVTVVLNADGIVIETRFDDDLEGLPLHELSQAVTEAAQAAATELARKSAELTAPIQERRGRMPKMSDLIDGLPDLTEEIPDRIPASTAPPNSPERQQHNEPVMTFTDVEDLEDLTPGRIRADDW